MALEPSVSRRPIVSGKRSSEVEGTSALLPVTQDPVPAPAALCVELGQESAATNPTLSLGGR